MDYGAWTMDNKVFPLLSIPNRTEKIHRGILNTEFYLYCSNKLSINL